MGLANWLGKVSLQESWSGISNSSTLLILVIPNDQLQKLKTKGGAVPVPAMQEWHQMSRWGMGY